MRKITKFICNHVLCSKKTVQLIQSKKELASDLIASWTVQVGDQDQCLHLWRITGGFEKIDKTKRELALDQVCIPVVAHWLRVEFVIAIITIFTGLCAT